MKFGIFYEHQLPKPWVAGKELKLFQDALEQAGMNKHEHICDSLELFGKEVMPEFKEREIAREAKKAEELAPFIEVAMQRKKYMEPLADQDIPVFPALGCSVVEGEADPKNGR